MFDQSNVQAKSRLGRLLVDKGMITAAQLDEALDEQLTTGRRLGEILMAQGWISARQLKRALRKQTSYRKAATFAAMIMGPIVPIASFAAPVGVQQAVEAAAIRTKLGIASQTPVINALLKKTTEFNVKYPSQLSILAANGAVKLSLPKPARLQYDNLCLRAPVAMCS